MMTVLAMAFQMGNLVSLGNFEVDSRCTCKCLKALEAAGLML